jgi:N-acetyl-S-(2-succino)cysteine monooxygenase
VRKPLHLALLVSAAGNHQGAWRRPDSGIERARDLGFYVELAQAAERAKLDAIFFADIPYLDTASLPINAPPFPLDPLLTSAAIAAGTSRIGLVTSISTTFSEPYTVARQLATLDHLSRGRAGWNIVTSATGEKNYGAAPLPDQDVRYARAAEHVDVVTALWDSWDSTSLVEDRATGRYADPAGARTIDHHGEHFDVTGPLNVLRPPQGWPVLFQAGSSPTGRDFAAATAEGVFTAQQTTQELVEFDADLRRRVAAAGRDPERVKILTGITPILGETAAEALDIERELGDLMHLPTALKRLNSYFPGVDLSVLDLDRPIPAESLPEVSTVQGRQSRYALFAGLTRDKGWTLRELARLAGRSDGHWTVTGSPSQVADAMVERVTDAGDGFVVMPTYQPQGATLFLEKVVPILQERGLFRTEYEGETLRDHLGLAVPARR